MSIKHVAWALDQGLPAMCKSTLITLADNASKEGVVQNRSLNEIAVESGMSARSISRHCLDLKRCGLITIHSGEGNQASEYQLNL